MNKQPKVMTLRPLPSIPLWSRYVVAPAVLAGWLTGIPAEAATVSVSLTFNHDYGGQLVNQANPVTDVFNLGPFLSPNLVVTSAAIEFQFLDDHDPLTVTSTDVTSYRYRNTTTDSSGFLSVYETDHYYRDSTIQQFNPAESAQLSIGGNNYNAATRSIVSSRYYTGTTLEGTTFLRSHDTSPGCSFFCSTTYVYRADYTDQYLGTTGFSGSMSIAATLDPLALGNLAQDGVLPFTVTAADGDFLFNTARLTVFVESVPIPASVWLFGSGLLGLVGVARCKAHTA